MKWLIRKKDKISEPIITILELIRGGEHPFQVMRSDFTDAYFLNDKGKGGFNTIMVRRQHGSYNGYTVPDIGITNSEAEILFNALDSIQPNAKTYREELTKFYNK